MISASPPPWVLLGDFSAFQTERETEVGWVEVSNLDAGSAVCASNAAAACSPATFAQVASFDASTRTFSPRGEEIVIGVPINADRLSACFTACSLTSASLAGVIGGSGAVACESANWSLIASSRSDSAAADCRHSAAGSSAGPVASWVAR